MWWSSGRYGALETWWHSYSDEDWAEADRLLDEVGFSAIVDRPFGVISEGERQHVLLARALIKPTRASVARRTGGRSRPGRAERLVSRLGALAAKPESPPMVLVTHHCEEIPSGFTHAGLVRQGKLVAAGPLADVITSSLVSACFDVQVSVGERDGRWWSRAV